METATQVLKRWVCGKGISQQMGCSRKYVNSNQINKWKHFWWIHGKAWDSSGVFYEDVIPIFFSQHGKLAILGYMNGRSEIYCNLYLDQRLEAYFVMTFVFYKIQIRIKNFSYFGFNYEKAQVYISWII